jgi:hypothetical protein
VYYSNTQRANARQAMASMHDHIAMTFPDLCPMHGPGRMGEPPSHARPVPAGAGGPVPHGASKAAEGGEDEAAIVAKGTLTPDEARQAAAGETADRKKLRRKLEKAVLKGDIPIDEARKQLGLAPFGFPVAITGEVTELEPAALKAAGAISAAVDPEIIKAAVADATAPLIERLDAQQKILDAIADQPDPRVEAYRGPVFNKTSAPPAAQPMTAAGYEDRVRTAVVKTMYDQWRNSPVAELREEAWNFLLKEAGIDMTKST